MFAVHLFILILNLLSNTLTSNDILGDGVTSGFIQ